jgi:hypothetical protein
MVAAELVVVAAPEAVLLGAEVEADAAEVEAEPPGVEPAPAPSFVAFFEPQLKLRQKVWPDKSLG